MGNLQKISQFVSQTGTSHKVAQEVLQGWEISNFLAYFALTCKYIMIIVAESTEYTFKQHTWAVSVKCTFIMCSGMSFCKFVSYTL